jgi:pyridoxamine 5'-phosphate oxidase
MSDTPDPQVPPGDPQQFSDPFALFSIWFDFAGRVEVNDHQAMALASLDETGLPDIRVVLMRAVSDRGFTFFTNFESAKGRELLARPVAAANFHWKSCRRQVRLRGEIEPVTTAEADAYFNGRPRLSQIGAWASEQSQVIPDRQYLLDRVAKFEEKYQGQPVPRPPHWAGFRLRPLSIEFWQDGAFRLHDRFLYRRASLDDKIWLRERLAP